MDITRIGSAAAFALAALCIPGAHAGEEPAAQAVEIKAVRTPMADTAYQRAYELAQRVQQASDGRVGVGIVLAGTHAQVRLDDLKAWVESDSVSRPLKTAPGGIVHLVADETARAEQGRLYLNKEAGSVRVKALAYVPLLDRDQLTVGALRRAIGDVRHAVRETTPALMRLALPRTWKFSVCMPDAGAELPLMDGAAEVARLAIDQPAEDDGGRPVRCRHFLPDDPADDRLRVLAPPGAQLLVLN